MGSIFAANPILDGDQVIYIYPDVGGSHYIEGFTRATSNKSDNLLFTFDTRAVTAQQTIVVKVNDIYDEFGLIGYSWSTDGGVTYNGATEIHSLSPVESPFIGVLGSTTYDQPGLVSTDYGDCLALAQKSNATGKQIVCKRFDYNSWAWGSEVVIDSATTVQSYPSAYMMDDTHIVIGFIDDTDTGDRKTRFYVSQDLLGLTWDTFNEFATTEQIYNLSLCKIGDTIIAAYDNGTNSKCRYSMNNGYYFSLQANEVTIKAASTDPYIMQTNGGLFFGMVCKGTTSEVVAELSQFGDTWSDIDTPNPSIMGDGLTEIITFPCGFLDDNGDLIALGRTSGGYGYMKMSDDVGVTWGDHTTISEVLPDNGGIAICDTGGYVMTLLRSSGTVKTINAFVSRVWTKSMFLSTVFAHNYLGSQGKPDDNGWTCDGSDNGSLSTEFWKIDTVTAGGAAQTYYKRTFAPTITLGFIDMFRMKITAGGGNDESCIRRYDLNNGISFSLNFSTTALLVKDLVATTTLKTDTHTYTALHDFVVAVKKVGSNVSYNIWRKEAASAWNSTWTLIANGVTDGYLAEGGARTSLTGWGDNDTASGKNSTSYWQNIFYQDATDNGLSIASPVLTSRKSNGLRTTMHRLTKYIGMGLSGAGAAKSNSYTVDINSNVSGSNLFSSLIDAPLMSNSDNINWSVYLSAQKYKSLSYYHYNFLGFKGANIRKMKVYGTNTPINPASIYYDSFGKPHAINGFPDETSWSLIKELDSYIGVTGVITSIGASWVTISGKTWVNNEHKGRLCELDTGATKKIYKIDENTTDTLIFYGTSLIVDGFTVGDTVNICSGEAAQTVTLGSYLFLKLLVEPTYTFDGIYKISYFMPARKYAPDSDFYNIKVDDGRNTEWKPNVEMYQGKSGLRRTFKQGSTRKDRQIYFCANNDSNEILELEKWLEHINFEETPVMYIEDDTATTNSNLTKVILGRFIGGLKKQHIIETEEKIEILTLSEEV